MDKKISNKEKILIVGFDVYGEYMYPHLKAVIDNLKVHCNVDYITFRERGAFDPIIFDRNICRNIKNIYHFIKIVKNTISDTLFLLKKIKSYNKIIAIDYYVYMLIGLMLGRRSEKKLILWSHDIIVENNPKSRNFFYKKFFGKIREALIKNKDVIIQDPDRLAVLCRTYQINESELQPFFLPVSLNSLNNEKKNSEMKLYNKPNLLQCGLIHPNRSSDKILMMYQKESYLYNLCFHGYLSIEFQNILKHINILPMISSVVVKSEELYQVIEAFDIGIISYDYGVKEENFFYIKNASGQLIEFLRMGKPIIVIGNNTNMNELVEIENIGVCIGIDEDLSGAVQKIANNYKQYSDNAYRCFNKYYNIKDYIDSLYMCLQDEK